ncbi:MAG TPA: hydroxymethylpyrimidine/phosphomethylpyrimidine kinase [Flavobacteriales bacterium]|nr:hydroxymethylpyrimidine/phosphomethylpyrimidine kinase [Flavobacteriales bacterium]
MREKKFVLSLAGLDPSAGAGLLSDIKTFEANNTYGLGVCTAITFQNESKIDGVSWVPFTDIQKQLTPIFKTYTINFVKIGLIENIKTFSKLIDVLMKLNPAIRIVWDPIIKSSSGYEFHKRTNKQEIKDVLKNIFLFTPNFEEMSTFFPNEKLEDICKQLGTTTAVLLKGGHGPGSTAKDLLFYNGSEMAYESIKQNTEKHGTGCVLSSAITASLAKGFDLEEACQKGKIFINSFLSSTETLLGYHHLENEETHL